MTIRTWLPVVLTGAMWSLSSTALAQQTPDDAREIVVDFDDAASDAEVRAAAEAAGVRLTGNSFLAPPYGIVTRALPLNPPDARSQMRGVNHGSQW